MDHNTIDALENLFLSLSDKTRLRLLGLMSDGEVSVGYLADSLGQSQPKVSRHLAYLRNAGLVTTRRDGKWIYYAVEPPEDEAAKQVFFDTLSSLSRLRFEPPPARPEPILYEAAGVDPDPDPDDRGSEMDVFLL